MLTELRRAALALALCGCAASPALAQPAGPAQAAPAPAGTGAAETQPAASPAAPVASPAVPAAAPATVDTGPLPAALSPWSMFLNADVVVKAVMVGLALASVFTWTAGLAKGAALVAATARARRAVAVLARDEGLGTAQGGGGEPRSRPVAAMVAAARDEVERSAALPAEGTKERAALALNRIEARAARAMTRGTGLVATIGSTAPFVGLFGTVWGIMNSFVGISRAHTSSLAVVAPGIAEALLATAIGLVAAIPAVVIFNAFSRATASYRALLADASAEVMRHLSRDLDRAARRPARAAE